MEDKKVLIIEDDLGLRNVLAEFLRLEGFLVSVASDGEEGLALINNSKPDIVLLDIILPKKNGFEVLKEVRDNKEKINIPFILLTNLGSLDDIEKALELGATTYLVKGDYQIKEIVEKIKEVLSK
ncbi:MAG: Two component transcriptional regulator, winged helix family [Candidatus Moranbacteria bacterium GW2011_GWE1_35_17]|nr:MAG: Two component transcriptional regulator, winged helix family [Candidatus Moranbacteria bacterium GW2011_GWE2_35_164]KKP68868.1 MAG: Two component transcriptional regulator, winged helix family [Candidatus Moranbacteria bacterium GW2011_GWE1_35_17]KKP84559.1 MAG: Two component transcriptional regulator, winged helix family [Candidatus Moranbacteria bacterium GW2011_GWF2_35_54]KKP84591.1 MAG: Two component transcriptional regulator, winged helix family [Candidatus Moranbacteria bacterium G